jgi:hypothetical protein
VEVTFASREVGVRNTKNRNGGTLAVAAVGWSAFVAAVKAHREN